MKQHYFFSQPHQPFFVLAFINSIIFMLLFMLSYKGILSLEIDSVMFHSYSLVYLFFTPALFAFLFTTFPRFLSEDPIKKDVYLKIFGLFILGSLIFLIGSFISPLVYKLGMVIVYVAFILSVKVLYGIHKSSDMPNKHDTFWILVGFVFGIAAYSLFLLEQFVFVGVQIAIFAYLFIVGFSVAQRMIPFFSHCKVNKNKTFMRNIMILISFHIVLELFNKNLSFIADIILAIIIAKELIRWKLPFPNTNPMLTILHVSLFWVPIAFFISFISKVITLFNDNYFLALDIHILMLGFLFTVLIGFGTRVTLGHSGNQMYADKLTKYLFIWTQIVILIRIFASVVAGLGWNYMVLFDISVTAWLIMFIVWAARFFKVLIFGAKLY
jgi:uncharacterized protein involved in response to NO